MQKVYFNKYFKKCTLWNFNETIEVLIKNNCELPTFSTLERLINNKRAEINNTIFDDVFSKLTEYEKKELDLMLEST